MSVIDEVQQAATRMRLAGDGDTPDTLSEQERKMVVFEPEVLARREEYYTQGVAYEATLKDKKSRLQYLKNMAKVRHTLPAFSRGCPCPRHPCSALSADRHS